MPLKNNVTENTANLRDRPEELVYNNCVRQTIVIGTRGSTLALKQADIAAAALRAVAASLSIEIRVIETHGDKDQRPIPLDQIGKGWFTKEIEDQLRRGIIDLAVHSLKDMREEESQGLAIGAYLPREDARDAIITKDGQLFEQLRNGAIIGTDSARRSAQVRALRSDVVVKSIRGNILTRLEKLFHEDYDAIILAVAGLKRINLESKITCVFEPSSMTPAPGQGILAVQMRANDSALSQLVRRINDPAASQAAHIERSFSRAMGGGCKSPVGAYAWYKDDVWYLIGMMQDPTGTIVREEMSDIDGNNLGNRLASSLLQRKTTWARHST